MRIKRLSVAACAREASKAVYLKARESRIVQKLNNTDWHASQGANKVCDRSE